MPCKRKYRKFLRAYSHKFGKWHIYKKKSHAQDVAKEIKEKSASGGRKPIKYRVRKTKKGWTIYTN